ncbi:MAG: S8 family peptidase [Chloroflexi bacterium]|nr:S8 family peptidase [Chloroflexota bacterium]
MGYTRRTAFFHHTVTTGVLALLGTAALPAVADADQAAGQAAGQTAGQTAGQSAGTTIGTTGQPGGAGGKVPLDPSLRAHPYLQYGAHKESGRRVRVIVQKVSRGASSQAIAQAAGAAVLKEFPFINGLVMEVPQQAVLALARNPNVRYVSPDMPLQLHGISETKLKTTYERAISIPKIWNGELTNGSLRATGKGVGVVVIDTGIDRLHSDFYYSKVTAIKVNGLAKSDKDFHGHGTHVCGVINGYDSRGRYVGVAPDAHVISAKITSDGGVATEADLLEGLQWAFDNRLTYNIRAVNISMTGGVASDYRSSPTAAAVEQLWLNGVVVVAAAGNKGSDKGATWYAPANDPFIITVGALDHNQTIDGADDGLAFFSSRGATQHGYYKPEIVAPGRKIVAPLAGGNTTLSSQFKDRIVDKYWIRLSGTSMAAPVVTGVVALLLEQFPNLTPKQVKWLLVNTANAYPGQADSAGVVDPVDALLTAASGSVGMSNQGIQLNEGIDPATGTVLWSQAYWDQAYWDQAYWDQAYWDQAYWDVATAYD